MVNSLRILGHNEVVHVLDCGLEPDQRAILAPETTIAIQETDSAEAATCSQTRAFSPSST